MARDVVPGPGEAGRDWQLVLVFADGGLWLDRERHDDLAVQALPDIRHKAATVLYVSLSECPIDPLTTAASDCPRFLGRSK